MKNNQFLRDQVRQSLQGYCRVLLALSGGVDSMVLLHLLVMQRQQQPDLAIRAVYIHHGLSANADLWGEHCQSICQQWQIPFQLLKVNVDMQQSGLEAGARVARYQIFSQHLQTDEVLLTAQHLDDQCETFLLALKRGSGPAGLSSMAANQRFGDSRQIRPLLNVSRQQIEDYAEENSVSWVNDESNQDDRFDRNFLRLNVLPIIQQRWPNFSQAVTRSAELCAEQEQLLDELLAQQLHDIVTEDGALLIPILKTMSDIKRQALIRRWFDRQQTLMPSRQQLQLLWTEVALAREDAEPQLKLANKTVRRFKQKLYLLEPMQDISQSQLSWDGKTDLQLPDNLGWISLAGQEQGITYPVRAPEPDEKISIRFQASGDFRIQGRQHSRSIKKLWQEFNVAPWQRGRIPLVYFNDSLITALGLFVTQEGQLTEGKSDWWVVWHKRQAV